MKGVVSTLHFLRVRQKDEMIKTVIRIARFIILRIRCAFSVKNTIGKVGMLEIGIIHEIKK